MLQSSASANDTANEVKTQLLCREGMYRLVPQADYGRPKVPPYAPQTNASNANSSSFPLVRLSFTKFVTNADPHRTGQHRVLNLDEMNNSNNNHPIMFNQQSFNGDTNQQTDDIDLPISTDDVVGERDFHHHYHHHQRILSSSNILQENQIQERICFNSGRELFVYIFNGIQPSDSTRLIDRKTYKSTSPTSHDFCTFVEHQISLLLIGFSQGQIQLIDLYRTEINNFYNQERLIDKSKVTCIRWLPHSKSEFLVSYSSGQMYLYQEDLPCFNATPTYQQIKSGEDFIVYHCKTRTNRNPLVRWSIGAASNHSAINEFAFSPCGQYLAVASQDGFLRVFNYAQRDIIGRMRSYFGGLLCLGWSPDSKFLVTGGEDDLITVWSLIDKRVIARGQGHKSWINSVTFDPFMTHTKDDLEEEPDVNHCNSDIANNSKAKPNDELRLLNNYRIGSVGQDTQICLWDLTDDIIRQSTVIKSRSRSAISSQVMSGTALVHCNNVDHSGTINNNNSSPLNSQNSDQSSSISDHNQQQHNNHHHHHHNFFNSLKKSGHKKGFSLSSRSFLDHGKSNKNHHSNTNKNSNDCNNMISNNNVHNNVTSNSSNISFCDSSTLLGSVLCPKLKEVPMLEPHVCKKISHERLTSVVFRRECIVIASHDGKIIVFARPNKQNFDSLKTSSPNASMASDVNEISIIGAMGDEGNVSEHCEQI